MSEVSKLDLQPSRIPFLDARTGEVSREWRTYFEQLGTRVGGPSAPTIKEIDAAVSDAKAAAAAAQESADAAAQAAQRASDSASFATTQPQAHGMTLEQAVMQILALQQAVTNLHQELRRLRDLETYTLGG